MAHRISNAPEEIYQRSSSNANAKADRIAEKGTSNESGHYNQPLCGLMGLCGFPDSLNCQFYAKKEY